jgi:thioredoxin-related protein
MKTISIRTLLLFLLLPAFVIGQKVDFVKGSWEEINKKARKEGKFIFVDAYTDWCSWCKVQDRVTFTNPEVAGILNSKFIPVKLNFEDSVNIPLAMKFRVSSFPSVLVFNTDGQLVKRIVGYTADPQEFIKNLNSALENGNERVYGFDSRKLDLNYPDFYKRAYGMGGKRAFPKDSVLYAYLDQQKDLFDEVNFSVLSRFNLNEKYQQFILDNHIKLKGLYGKEEVNGMLESIVYHKVEAAAKAGATEEKFWEITEYCNFYTTEVEKVIPGLKLYFYESAGDWPSYFFTAQSNFKELGFNDAGEINSVCWKLFENLNDFMKLKTAATWMEKLPLEDQDYAYLDTYASLLYKTKQYPKAEKYARLAIKKGKDAKEKTEATEELLQKINDEMKKK